MIETRAYDKPNNGFLPDPVVVLVVTGTHDVSRLVHLLAGAPPTIELIEVGQIVVKQVRRHNGGRAALALLKAHGGADFTERPAPVVRVKITPDRVHLVCPYDDCGQLNAIQEENRAVSLDSPLAVRIEDSCLVVRWDDECGSSPDWEHHRYLCAACQRTVRLPEPTEVPA